MRYLSAPMEMFVLNTDLWETIKMKTSEHRGLEGRDLLWRMKTKSEQEDILNENALWNAAEESNNCNFLFVKRHLASASIFYSFLMIQGNRAKSNGSSMRFFEIMLLAKNLIHILNFSSARIVEATLSLLWRDGVWSLKLFFIRVSNANAGEVQSRGKVLVAIFLFCFRAL